MGETSIAKVPSFAAAGTAPVPSGMILGYLDLAIRGVLEYPRFSAVYLGPWWDMSANVDLDGVEGWKRAVLRRVPHGGAQHWGHLFLIMTRRWAKVEVDPERFGLPSAAAAQPTTSLQLRAGDPHAVLIGRPSRPERAGELAEFMHEVVDRFVYQRD
ncbi:MAG: hypothetical protein L3K23_02865 [Thermoplasmata archaeon]|nr:hypothetical protein [Thermoplasmata archaeon]